MSQSRNQNRSSNSSRRNRGDPARHRAQPVTIQNSKPSRGGAGNYAQKFKQSKAPSNPSAPPRRSAPPRSGNQVHRQIPHTRQPPARQAPPSRQAPPQNVHYSHQQRPAAARPPPPKTYQLQENERFGKVRKVISGDCVEVYFKEKHAEKIVEKKFQVNLDGVRAPRILRSARDEQKHGRSDELFAWESREFLRKLLAHQIVVVKTSADGGNNKSKGKSIYAVIKVRPGDMGNRPITEHDTLQDVALISLEKGLTKVKTEVKDPNPDYVAMEETAKENEAGLWEPQPELIGRKNDKSWFRSHHREVTFNPDPVHFFEEHKGKPLQGIVEDVTEGTRIKVEIIFTDQQGSIRTSQIILNLSGVISPKTGNKPREQEEPFGEFARNFTMVRMQHCDVTVYLDVIDGFNNIYGHIEFLKGDIGLELVKNGCARVVPWTAQAMGTLDEYLRMESRARQNKIRMWSAKEFEDLPVYGRRGHGVVKEVTSGDSIQVLVDDELQRFYLASLQAPRRNNKNRGGPDPFYAEAKEYVRKQIIGKTIKFRVEYQRNAQNQSNRKAPTTPFNYVTLIYDDNKNLNEELIQFGLCKAVNHRKSEPRSVGYKRLLELQKGAEALKIGVFSPPDKLPKPETDFTNSRGPRRRRGRNERGRPERTPEETTTYNEALEYCEARLGFVTREERANGGKPEFRRVPAICEFVFNGERMKVRLSEDNVVCNLILADIRFEKDDKFASEAKTFCKDFISQQEIEVEVERLDRSARFIGHVFFDDGSGGELQNLAEELLARGWALPLEQRRGPGSKYASDYSKALASAKEGQVGRWEGYEEPEPEPERQPAPRGDGEENDGQQRKPVGRQRDRGRDRGRGREDGGRGGGRRDGGRQRGGDGGRGGDGRRERRERPQRRGGAKNVKIQVTVIEDGVTFFAQEKNSKTAKRVEEAMSKINPATADFPEGWEPKRHVVCAGLYVDGKYYRCQVLSQKKGSDEVRVRWIDFGETGTIDHALLLPLQNEKGKPSLEEVEPLARKCKLAGLKTPPENTDYFNDAQNYLIGTINSGADVKYDVKRDAKTFALVILKVDGKDINDLMVRNGFARVMRTRDNREDEYIQHLTQIENDAKANHTGQWEYGDLGSDEEDDRRGGGRRGRGRN